MLFCIFTLKYLQFLSDTKQPHSTFACTVIFLGADLAGMIVRDVTPRYASDWCTRVYKQRLDRDWWMETLRPFEPLSVDEQREEDEDIIGVCTSDCKG